MRGNIEVGVKPGMVLTSLTVSVPSAPTKKSTRASPSQSSASYARRASGLELGRQLGRQVGGDVELGGGVEVLGVEVVELVVADDADLRGHAGLRTAVLVLEDAALDLATDDGRLDEHLGVAAQRLLDRPREVGELAHLADADAGAAAGGLDEHRQAERPDLRRSRPPGPAPSGPRGRRRQG